MVVWSNQTSLKIFLLDCINNEYTKKFSTVVSDKLLVEHTSKIISNISIETSKDVYTFLVKQLRFLIETPNQPRFFLLMLILWLIQMKVQQLCHFTVFMISSLLSVLIPAKNLIAENLCNILKNLLKRLAEAL